MEECKNCQLAIYCYTDSSTWTFRTTQEMEEKQEAMAKCSFHKKAQQICALAAQKCTQGNTV
ncbi:hypothetical protein DAMNIGENAA_15650 [Desulforhabdus amnigena]|jgi:hypothetical protein|uniref:Uncharacterized protein n=1 Tax=Desulforhabdus amnigena TaxID=40218 RepID=A0A9W6D125_9BACT|nr:hypothetical protein DAMNIGENAA_15650 [Desulforhabdus amnigena]